MLGRIAEGWVQGGANNKYQAVDKELARVITSESFLGLESIGATVSEATNWLGQPVDRVRGLLGHRYAAEEFALPEALQGTETGKDILEYREKMHDAIAAGATADIAKLNAALKLNLKEYNAARKLELDEENLKHKAEEVTLPIMQDAGGNVLLNAGGMAAGAAGAAATGAVGKLGELAGLDSPMGEAVQVVTQNLPSAKAEGVAQLKT